MAKKETEDPGTALAKVEPGAAAQYALMTVPQAESLAIIRENLGANGTVQAHQLDRAKIPTGGGTIWQVPSLEGEEGVKEIKGIIIFWSEARRYWSQRYSAGGAGQRPDCYSDDGTMGQGAPGGECAACKFAEFGTARKDDGALGRGQACKQIRQLFVIRQDDFMPLVVTLPPTSLNVARSYFLRLAGKMIPYYGMVTSLALEKTKNKDGTDYSRTILKACGRLSKEELQAVSSIRAALVPSIQKIRAENSDFAEAATQ